MVFAVLVLYRPDTVLPRFAQPELSEPKFWIPEFPTAASPLFHRPELVAPKFAMPDVPPVPALKKPDDGLAVVFPIPGAAGMSRNVIVRLSIAPTILMGMLVVGPPTLMVMVGTVSVDAPRLMGPRKNKPPR
ncbi:hypothetical protein MYBA111488_17165 [Mycobacterium basiliense]